jgi:hypothetical protein
MVSPRKSDPSGKKVSKLYVEPAELARKLIKELEGTKVSQGGQTWVRDQYTVFLCREDFQRFRSHLDELVRKLEAHMEKHVLSRRYGTSGAITIELTMDPDLKPGYFGVLAERADLDDSRSYGDLPDDADYGDDYEDYVTDGPGGAGAVNAGRGHAGDPFAGVSSSAPPMPRPPSMGVPVPGVPLPVPPVPGVPPVLGPSYGRPFPPPPGAGQQPQQAGYPAPSQVPPRTAPPVPPIAGGAGRVAATDGVTAGAATEQLVLKVNGQERVFPQGKAVVGRSRDVDLMIDNADVSRRHAMIYWSEGSIVVKDLGSTNGTMVNGYPIDSTVVRPSDVIRIGNCHITAASR